MIVYMDALVVVADDGARVVELHLHAVGQFHIVAVTLLVDLRHRGTGAGGVHILLDGSGYEGGGYCYHVVAIHLVPVAAAVEVNLRAVVEVHLKLRLHEFGVFLCIDDGLAGEVLLEEGVGRGGQLRRGHGIVVGTANGGGHEEAGESCEEKFGGFHNVNVFVVDNWVC